MEETIKKRQVEIMLVELIEVVEIDVYEESGIKTHWLVKKDNVYVNGSTQITHKNALRFFELYCEMEGKQREEKLIKKSIIKK
tara:strand:- start:737 stop:985 length:249 start_codon:yes stop_codon:yes gene_type:complete